MNLTEKLENAAEIITNSEAILINTGAGMGVDSGLPDFRGNQGFWEAYPPIAKLKLDFSEMANPQWFRVDPQLAWAFYGHRLNLYRSTKPHAGYAILLKIAKTKKKGYFAFTSNVDGQFQKANFPDDKIVEIHGSINHFQCCTPCLDDIWSAQNAIVSVDMDSFKAQMPLPKCRHCNTTARPNILMFGDFGWIPDRSMEQQARLQSWLTSIGNARLAVVELGAGRAVPTVRHFSGSICKKLNAKLIRINPREYQISQDGIGVPMGALEALRKIDELLS